MSLQHHDRPIDPRDNFIAQTLGDRSRQYPDGRISPDDEGASSYAMATDAKHGVIRIQFPAPVNWIGLDLKSATELRDQLTERCMELRGITA